MIRKTERIYKEYHRTFYRKNKSLYKETHTVTIMRTTYSLMYVPVFITEKILSTNM